MPAQPLGVTARGAMLTLGEGGFGHEGAETCVVGLAGELDQLLLRHPEVVARRPQLVAHRPKSALDLGPGHEAEHRLGPMKLLRWIPVATLVVSGCGSGPIDGCVEVREPEDPASDRHLVQAEGFRYRTTPPTSGPHVAGPTPSGTLDGPVAEPVQVRILEAGGVMVQYSPAIDPDALEPIAGTDTVVAPGVDLPAPVVATAWTWKLTCDRVDIDRLQSFAADRRGAAPGLD